jgi:hypothetical protein
MAHRALDHDNGRASWYSRSEIHCEMNRPIHLHNSRLHDRVHKIWFQRLSVIAHGLLEVTLPEIRVSAIVVGRGNFGVEQDRFGKIPNRLDVVEFAKRG